MDAPDDALGGTARLHRAIDAVIVIGALCLAACAESHGPRSAPPGRLDASIARTDAGSAGVDAAGGPVTAPEPRPPGGPYEPCGDPTACAPDLRREQHDTACVCMPNCMEGACPPTPPGIAGAVCTGWGSCDIPCPRYGDPDVCPAGLVCGVTVQGLRCSTTADEISQLARPDTRTRIEPFELYGACNTSEQMACPPLATGTGFARRDWAGCTCTARCIEDEHCPQPPTGYGRAVCLTQRFSPFDPTPGFCALVCQDGAVDFACPDEMRCAAPPSCEESFLYVPQAAVSVCRNGPPRHGDGDDLVEPGEVYGPWRDETARCDPGLGTTTAGGGRCIVTPCCEATDCPSGPPGFKPPVCSSYADCHLGCEVDADCPPPSLCTYVGSTIPLSAAVKACE